MFVVYVYAEEGHYDGQSFVAGVFDRESAAQLAEGALSEYGSTDVLPVYDTRQLRELLREGRS